MCDAIYMETNLSHLQDNGTATPQKKNSLLNTVSSIVMYTYRWYKVSFSHFNLKLILLCKTCILVIMLLFHLKADII